MDFIILAQTFDKLEGITSRIQLTNVLVELFKKTPPDIIDKVVYLIQGRLWPEWSGLPELGVGEKFLIKAVSIATKASEAEVERLYKQLGDLGKAAEQLRQRSTVGGLTQFIRNTSKQSMRLSVERVYETLSKVASMVGEGSRDIKIKLIAGLLMDSEPLEAKYLVRLIEGRLRLGVGDATILDALAICYAGSQSYRAVVERAYNIRADLGNVAKTLASAGVESLKVIKPKVGVPIRPMLAERLSDPKEILDKVGGKALVEFKYDGERAQIHKSSGNVWVFSRRLENITHQYPDVVEALPNSLRCDEAVVEGEIVAVDPNTNELRAFQELMHRKRKHDIHEVIKDFPVRLYLFDVLYVDGEDLTTASILTRKKYLQDIVVQSDMIRLADSLITDDVGQLENFFLKAVESGCEGVVAKAIHDQAVYQAGARGWLWIKYKRDYKSEMIDTVDLVVVGAFYGRGRRGGKYGALLMAAYDSDTDTFKTVCKVGSGFTDEDLEKIPTLLQPYIIGHKHPRVDSELEPDVWVVPALVAEVIGAELTLSPLHTCGKGKVKEGVGISIRFPRFLRWRDEKKAEDATTVDELVEMYRSQLKKIVEETAQEPV